MDQNNADVGLLVTTYECVDSANVVVSTDENVDTVATIRSPKGDADVRCVG